MGGSDNRRHPRLFAAPSANSESPLAREAKFALAYGTALLVLSIFGKNLPLEKGAASALLAWVSLILLKITRDITRIGRWRVIMGVAVVLVMLTVTVLLFTGLRAGVGSKDLLPILTSSAVSFAMNIASVRLANVEGGDDDRLGTRVQEPASPLGMILPRARLRRRGIHSHATVRDEDVFQGQRHRYSACLALSTLTPSASGRRRRRSSPICRSGWGRSSRRSA